MGNLLEFLRINLGDSIKFMKHIISTLKNSLFIDAMPQVYKGTFAHWIFLCEKEQKEREELEFQLLKCHDLLARIVNFEGDKLADSTKNHALEAIETAYLTLHPEINCED